MGETEHITELLPAYALDILEEEQIFRVEAHLTGCPACHRELEGYLRVVEQLPLGAPEAYPPPELKRRLMANLPRSSASRVAGDEAGPAMGGRMTLADFFRRLSPVWWAASLVLVLGLAISNLLLWQQVRELRPVRQETALEVIDLSGTDYAQRATGVIVMSMDGEHGTLVVDRLPVLGEDQEYQLWLIRDEERESGGVFSVDDDGYGAVWVHAAEPLASYPEFGVTVEPAGGSPGPTGPRVLGGEID